MKFMLFKWIFSIHRLLTPYANPVKLLFMKSIEEVYKKQKAFFLSGRSKDLKFRKEQLKKFKAVLLKYEDKLKKALKEDLGKSETESYATEIGIVLSELNYTLRHFESWARKKRVYTPLLHFPSSSYIITEPLGNTLIMSPWNYPVQLTLVPLIGAISSGCTAIVKPSRYSEKTSEVLKELIDEAFCEEHIALFLGGRDVNTELLSYKWDYIFFTGSPNVGKIVAEKAGRDLTKVTLELGGKSPAIIDESADIKITARRLAFAKFINAGQTCVAPDYIFVHKKKSKEFLTYMVKAIEKCYGNDQINNDEFGKIINAHHFERLCALIDGSPVYYGGLRDQEKNKIGATILFPVKPEDPVMQEEIFGPVMAVMEYESLDDVISFIQKRPRPLALYVFSEKKKTIEKIHSSIVFGGGCINDGIMHLVSHSLPFGGVGESGIGSCHGKRTFLSFSHEKGILDHKTSVDITLRSAPFGKKEKIIKMILH